MREFLRINISTPGIYWLGGDGATGKTLLGRLMNSAAQFGKNYYVFSGTNGMGPVTALRKTTATVILLDRADLYISQELVDYLLSDEGKIYFIDLKSINRWSNLKAKPASIIRTKDCMEVNIDAIL